MTHLLPSGPVEFGPAPPIGSAKNYTLGFTVIAVIAFASIVLTVVTRIPRTRHDAHEGPVDEVRTGGLVASQNARTP